MWHLLAKNMLLVSGKRKILHTSKLPRVEKKHLKIIFLSGASNIVKIVSEIYKYLPNISLNKSLNKYLKSTF